MSWRSTNTERREFVGLFQTRWEARVSNGSRVTVIRNEWTKGLKVYLDDVAVATKPWSWIGLTHVAGSAEADGHATRIEVTTGPRSSCALLVDGVPLATTRIR
jgi:hypothetical protein